MLRSGFDRRRHGGSVTHGRQADIAMGDDNANGADFLNKLFKRGEMWLAAGLLLILTVLVVPIPPFMVDMGLAISITLSVVIVMTVLFIQKPLDFSAFQPFC